MALTHFKELYKLALGLEKRNIEYCLEERFLGGYELTTDFLTAVCSDDSMGGAEGLIEIKGDLVNEENSGGDISEGYLTAKEILQRIDEQG